MSKEKASLWIIVVFIVILLSTALYVAINGYDKWKGDMKTAVAYSLIANTDPTTQVIQPVPVAKKNAVPNKKSGQFECPVHGATGLPDYDSQGDPVCQICGRKMDMTHFK